MTVSAALIVRNEERSLSRCLESIKGAFDEIVIVDTGSEDDTKKMARRYSDRVYELAWRNDFAAARQYAFDLTTGDWVVWLDADDVVLNADRIRPLIETAKDDVGGFYWRYIYDRDNAGNIRCEFWRERCVRNDGSFRWVGRIHEVLVSNEPRPMLQSGDVIVEHRREETRASEHLRRNLEILEDELKSHGDESPRLLVHLARDCASAGKIDRALSFYTRYLRVASWADEKYFAQTQVADLYRAMRRYEQAINADLQALRICPHWPDAYFGLAETYYYLKDWSKVIHWTEVGRAMPQPDTIHIVNPMDYRYNWIIYYTNALYHAGEMRDALTWTKRALEICPDDPWHRENFLSFARAFEHQRPGNRAEADSPRLVFSQPCADGELVDAAAANAQQGVDVLIPTLHEDDPRIRFCREVLEMTDDAPVLYLKGPGTFAEKINSGLGQTSRPYVLILNDDVAVPPGLIHRMKAHFARNPKLGVLGVFSNCDYRWHHQEQPLGVGINPALEQIQKGWATICAEDERRAGEFAGESVDIPWAAFYCVMIPRRIFEEVGRLDERFKNCSEDVDFCRRARRAAYEIRYAQDGWVIHFGGTSLTKQENATRERHTHESNRLLSHKEGLPSVGFYCPLEWEPWSPRLLRTQGAGGSETAAIHMARLLANIGHEVTVFNQNDGERWYEGVSYVDYGKFNPCDPLRVLIAWRAPEMADFGEIGQQRYLWMHDIDLGDRLTPERAEKFSGILALSEAHKAHLLTRYPFLEEDRLLLTRNGLDLTRFEQTVQRDPHRLIYSSSPDRGLDVLLTMFPRIRDRCPDATLAIFFGGAGFERAARFDPGLQTLKGNLARLLDQPGVTYHGQVDQSRLGGEMLGSALWVYPTYFTETSCITAMEAQAAGAVPVTRPLGALGETVRFGVLIDGDVHAPETQTRYIDEIVSLLQRPEKQEQIREKMVPWARATFGWEDVAAQWQKWFVSGATTRFDKCGAGAHIAKPGWQTTVTDPLAERVLL